MGTTRGHRAQAPASVVAYTLFTERLTVTVWTYGATLVEAIVPDAHGRCDNVVVRLPSVAAYEDRIANPYVGSTLGRFARCISNARFELDGITYSVEPTHGPHHFHGGSIGFDRFVWEAEAGQDDDTLWVRLTHDSADGDQGYPGALNAEAVYRVHPDGLLALDYRATSSSSTIVGLTNHAYWNLAGRESIDRHCLTVAARRVIPTDGDLIPTGAPADVAGTAIDYSTARVIGETTLDHCFVLDSPGPAAELYEPTSGRFLRVSTNQPALALYTGERLAPPRAGLCIQTTAFPDAPNRIDYPSACLEPGQTYCNGTSYEFGVR